MVAVIAHAREHATRTPNCSYLIRSGSDSFPRRSSHTTHHPVRNRMSLQIPPPSGVQVNWCLLMMVRWFEVLVNCASAGGWGFGVVDLRGALCMRPTGVGLCDEHVKLCKRYGSDFKQTDQILSKRIGF